MLLVGDLQQVCFVLPHSGERHAAAAYNCMVQDKKHKDNVNRVYIRVNLCCLHTLQWFPFCIVLDK